jgi:hypothetical protein
MQPVKIIIRSERNMHILITIAVIIIAATAMASMTTAAVRAETLGWTVAFKT